MTREKIPCWANTHAHAGPSHHRTRLPRSFPFRGSGGYDMVLLLGMYVCGYGGMVPPPTTIHTEM